MRDFLRPVATLLTGTTLAQLVVYAARPLLTRLFSPEEFGALGFYAGVVAVIASLSTGKYEDALVLPRDDGQASSLAAAAVIATVVTSVAVAVVIPFRTSMESLVSSAEAIDLLAFVPASVLFVGLARTGDAWLTRNQLFGSVARGRVVHAFTTVPAQAGGGFAGLTAVGLVGGLVAGQFAQAFYYGTAALRARIPTGLLAPSLREIRRAAARYRRFAVFGAPATTLNTASVQLPALLLLFFFDAAVLGNYAVGYSALAVPLTLLGSAVAQVYFVQATEARHTGTLPDLTGEVFKRLVAIGIYPIAAVALTGPELFRFVFGASWSTAGTYASYLAPWVFFVFVSSPLSKLLDIFEKQKALFLFNASLLVSRGCALVVGGNTGDAGLAIGLFGAVGAIMWLAHTLWMLRLASVRIWTAVSLLRKYTLIAAAPVLVLAGVKLFGGDVSTSAAAVVCGLAYYFAIHRTDPVLLTLRPSERN